MSAYEKSLKQKIRGPEHIFHLIVSPGFETYLEAEIAGFDLKIIEKDHGFIRIQGKISQLLKFSFYTTLTNRIYIELGDFHVGASEEFFRKVSLIQWEFWLSRDTEIAVDIIHARSRFSHEGRIEETLKKSIQRRLSDFPETPINYPKTKILVRMLDNHAHIKLDLSGELHYRRGYRTSFTKAPLRESLAAGLIRWAFEGLDFSSAEIYDPMCGSGTFGSEAHIFLSEAGAGRFRMSPLLSHPVFSPEKIKFEQNAAIAKQEISHRIHMSDIDLKSIESAKENQTALAKIIGATTSIPLQSDFFELEIDKTKWSSRPLLCLNPPWGIRLSGDNSLYNKIIERIFSKWQGARVLLLAPSEFSIKLTTIKTLTFSSGGIALKAYCFDA